MTSASTAVARRSPAQPAPDRPADRLLDTATKLFAYQGIRAVGIDLILREANVAKSSLYSCFGSKEALVIAYLERLDQADRNRWNERTRKTPEPHAGSRNWPFSLVLEGSRSHSCDTTVSARNMGV